MCQKGYPNLCALPTDASGRPTTKTDGNEIDQMAGLGTFGTETLVPQDAVVPIDKDMPLAQAALIGCGVMTGVGAAINTAQVSPGSSVAVWVWWRRVKLYPRCSPCWWRTHYCC